MSGDALVAAIRAGLASASNVDNAVPMQRYMKSTMPFRGVKSPEMRAIVRPLIREYPLTDAADWERTVRALYDEAAFREERYAALEVAGHRLYLGFRGPEALGLYAHLIVTGAWWDLVDWTASLADETLRTHPEPVRPVIWSWAAADDLWLRRVAIISQLKAREATDLDLLTHAIDTNVEGTRFGSDFFIRKAIGWALRQHARVDPAWVRAFVDERGSRLSGLSRREALKHLT